MALRRTTQADLKRELGDLRDQRVRLDQTIAAVELLLANRTSGAASPSALLGVDPSADEAPGRVDTGARPRRGTRKRVKGTQVVAALLKRAGKPLAPRDIAALAMESGRRITYNSIYTALRKSPLFAKSGEKRWFRDQPSGAPTSAAAAAPARSDGVGASV